MAVSTSNFYETPSPPASTHDAMREMWWFINGSHPTAPNSIWWECVECWDGATRAVPPGGRLSSLPSSNGWAPSETPEASLPVGSWGVFRSRGGAVAAQFQVYVNFAAADVAGHSLISLDDWTVGGGTGPSPTLPATMLGQPAIDPEDGRMFASSTLFWSVIVDEGRFIMKQFPASGGTLFDLRWAYVGEVDPTTNEADDPRPFIMARTTAFSWSGSYSHIRLSPVDQLTIVQLRNRPYYLETAGSPTSYTDLGVDYLCNVALDAENPAGHRFIQGYFRGVGATSETALANRATLGSTASDFAFEAWGNIAGRPWMVTRYPVGTALPGGHTIIADESIPAQLPEIQIEVAPIARVGLSIRHLFPRASQWNLTYLRPFVSFMRGIEPSLDAAANNADSVWTDLIPATTTESTLAIWERQWALRASSSLTVQERRDRLAATWAALGGQSPSYIQTTLQAQGFAVYVHEWWDLSPSDYPVAKDPRDYLRTEFGGTDTAGYLLVNDIRTTVAIDEIGAGEAWAEAGEPRAVAGYYGGYSLARIEATYVGPETRHPYYLYIGGETFPNTVNIPTARREEFEHLCQKICPAHQWLVLRVEYI